MRTEEEIKRKIEEIKKQNPLSWLRKCDEGTRGWVQGQLEFAKWVLESGDKYDTTRD